MAKSRSVLIAGGGIAGLTAALLLSRQGLHVEVFEQSEKFSIHGAGIQLSPNALRILEELEVGRQIRMTATIPHAIKILGGWRANELAEVPLGAEAITRYGLPYLCLHRADLHQALLVACRDDPDIRIHMGCSVLDCTSHPNGVSLLAKQGENINTHRGRFFVCADGIHSKIRTDTFEGKASEHTGFEAWRAMIPTQRISQKFSMDFTHLVMARGGHAVLYPVRNGRYLNVVVILKAGKHRTDKTVLNADPTILRKKIRFWSSHFKALFAQTDDWSVWPILNAPSQGSWHSDSMVMIGDAAHGMPPFAAQGAAMAIEDAKVLAQSIEAHTDLNVAFTSYEEQRKPRVKKVAQLANTNRQLYHMGFPFSFVRNMGMKLTPSTKLLTRQSWIYDWRP